MFYHIYLVRFILIIKKLWISKLGIFSAIQIFLCYITIIAPLIQGDSLNCFFYNDAVTQNLIIEIIKQYT